MIECKLLCLVFKIIQNLVLTYISNLTSVTLHVSHRAPPLSYGSWAYIPGKAPLSRLLVCLLSKSFTKTQCHSEPAASWDLPFWLLSMLFSKNMLSQIQLYDKSWWWLVWWLICHLIYFSLFVWFLYPTQFLNILSGHKVLYMVGQWIVVELKKWINTMTTIIAMLF